MYTKKILNTYSVPPLPTLDATAREAGAAPEGSVKLEISSSGEAGITTATPTTTAKSDELSFDRSATTHSLLPDSFRKSYANAKELLEKSLGRTKTKVKQSASLTSLDQLVIDGVEQDHELHTDRAAKTMGRVKLVVKAGDMVDLGVGKAADLFEAAGVMEQFCETIAAAPAARTLKVATGVIDGAKAIRKRQLANHGTNKLIEQLSTARKLEIVGRFTDHNELVRASERNQSVDSFLYAVLEKAKHGQELETFVAALETASGACMIAGIVSGNPAALTASTALGITSTAIKVAEVAVNEGEIKYYKGKRLEADERLAAGTFKKWAAITGVTPGSTNSSVDPLDLHIGADVQPKEFINSLWYKEDMAKLIVARIKQRPRNKVYGRVLEICGEDADAFVPEKFNKLSRLGKRKLIESIEAKLSGKDKTVKGIFANVKLTIKALRETLNDQMEKVRNKILAVTHRVDLKQYSVISSRAAALVELSAHTDVDPEEVIIKTFDQAIEEGVDSERALRNLLHFSDLPHKKELAGSNEPGRLKARLVILQAIVEHLKENPEDTIEAACEQVDEEIDVVDLAQQLSLTEESITLKGELLRRLASAHQLDPVALIDAPFQDAIDAGAETVEALHNLLHFSGWPHKRAQTGTTAWSRLETRLVLLETLAKYQESNADTSLLHAIEAVEQSVNKTELARMGQR